MKDSELQFAEVQPSEYGLKRNQFWQQHLQIDVQVLADFPDDLKTLPYDFVFLDPEQAKKLLSSMTSQKTETLETSFADSLLKIGQKFWLNAFVGKALYQTIVQKVPDLNTHRKAYITGAEFSARLSIVTAIKMGFQNISWVLENPEAVSSEIDQIKKKFFGIHLEVIQDSELTLQPSNGSLLINTATQESDAHLVVDLTYLNFLDKRQSLVIDLTSFFKPSAVIEEGLQENIVCIRADEMLAYRDFLVLSEIKNNFSESWSDYQKKWQSFLA